MLNTKLLGSVSAPPAEFIDDLFQTFLYTGNGTTQTINNGIDLAGEGGLVWIKNRNLTGGYYHVLTDTVRGATKELYTDYSGGTYQEFTNVNGLTSFNSNGFSIGSYNAINENNGLQASWTFREQAKFFDVVTYTGNGTAGRTVAHNLGSAPGMIIIKRTDSAGYNWVVYHRSLGASSFLTLDTTSAAASIAYFNGVSPTSTNFTLNGGGFGNVNASGATYVAYLFAHDAGGFGAAGTDNVISCGTFTTATSTLDVTLGYEPQYVMFKRTDDVGDWQVYDNMRGFPDGRRLSPNTSAAEDAGASIQALATGFNVNTTYNATFIYMAIRRPMKPPTSGTEVFSPITSSATTGTVLTTGFPIDFQIETQRPGGDDRYVIDRLRGINTTGATGQTVALLRTNVTDAQQNITTLTASNSWNNTSFKLPSNFNGISSVYYSFRRATGFFDVVCYTGTGSATTQAHNLGVAPEMMIIKKRSGAGDWFVYSSTGIDTGKTYPYPRLNGTEDGWFGTSVINATAPTSSVFTIDSTLNTSTSTYVAYLFATVAGVSKVGSYTGNGSSQTINCGFTAGARFVMIKRTDSTGDWFVWDTARGIIAGNDPYLLLNSTAAEVTSTDYIDPVSSGFEISSTAPAAINASGGSYIYLAIA